MFRAAIVAIFGFKNRESVHASSMDEQVRLPSLLEHQMACQLPNFTVIKGSYVAETGPAVFPLAGPPQPVSY
jgi:hypothetical protein